MKNCILLALAAALPSCLFAGAIDFGSGTPFEDTVSFNGAQDTVTLGSDQCSAGTCSFAGTFGDLLSSLWQFSQPDLPTSPFSYTYDGSTGTVTINGSPSLMFLIEDANFDEAEGTFALTGLQADGGNGVDILGTITFTSFVPGINGTFSQFETEFGLPTSGATFVIDVGDCTAGSKTGVNCVPQSVDPTATFLSGSFTPNTSSVPEPATSALLAAGLGLLAFSNWKRSSRRSR